MSGLQLAPGLRENGKVPFFQKCFVLQNWDLFAPRQVIVITNNANSAKNKNSQTRIIRTPIHLRHVNINLVVQ